MHAGRECVPRIPVALPDAYGPRPARGDRLVIDVEASRAYLGTRSSNRARFAGDLCLPTRSRVDARLPRPETDPAAVTLRSSRASPSGAAQRSAMVAVSS